MAICMMCLEEVDRDVLLDELGYIFAQADRLGMESLTEFEQVVTEDRICGVDCYYAMIRSEADYWKELRRKQVPVHIGHNGDTTFYGGPEGGE